MKINLVSLEGEIPPFNFKTKTSIMNISKLFKFDWLKSEERIELEKLRKEKQEKEKLEEFYGQEAFEEIKTEDYKKAENQTLENFSSRKPYRSRRLIGDNLIVILWDGSPLQGSKDLYDAVGEAKDEKEIIGLFVAKEEVVKEVPLAETPEEKQLVRDNWEILRNHSDFVIKGDEVYFKGVSLALPAIVAVSFIHILELMEGEDTKFRIGNLEQLEEQYQALKMFWLKLAVNPIENSRNQLLTFVKKNDVRITSTGNLVLYRKIVTVEGTGSQELIAFISQQYTKIKKWKKSPTKYFIWGEDNGTLVLRQEPYDKANGIEKLYGNLEQLYLDLPTMQENSYTSQSNKGKYTIKIGEVYKIDDSELNTDASVCHGGGLHAACVTYNYGGYGDVPVVVLVNPSKALTVPYSDAGKLRTTEMFVMCINDKPLGVHYDDDGLMICDEQYNDYSIKELETVLVTKDFTPLCMEDKTTEVNLKDLALITEALKNRIVKI